ncbi:hypothetical protein AGABI1DRAFT_125878 [Agaricus bisporus var. burnettii JB137-S8]|uniref:Uncharacterized protein n=1 Tax=Agaricus bisporus var. burnettii (strain JB137-S8 / ATCC MYA-4627 / FGSC 10392) TaxID=597362 RepID=K5W3X1_AGABU|nr:uncharacterized protein AGABI1DRAFT_125878 [Agaricus bisporus var. burnettii JB137-S8]EKM81494.1 hypothetical protein AGABI1DRAFT_125878 [Agaricus bisporus var. burnettii JB137-S8]
MTSHRHGRAELSVIPDLRYEYSYLNSIRRFVNLERISTDISPSSRRNQSSDSEEKLSDSYEDLEERELKASLEEQLPAQKSTALVELVHVQWKNVFWFTTRDQIITPFLQGALWGLASYYLTPYSRELGTKLRHFVPHKEGTFAGWLRTWGKSFMGR